jgi:hypothetical protein
MIRSRPVRQRTTRWRLLDPTGYPEWVVPPLGFSSGLAEGVKISERSTGTAAILVPPSTTSQTVTAKFTAAGSSGLPGNLLLKALRDVPG